MEHTIQEIIGSYVEYANKIPQGSIQIANYLREDDVTSALNMIVDFAEGVQWLIQVTQLLDQQDVKLNFNIETINEFLNEINEGLSIQDYVLVADLFEYEIAPYFENNEFVVEQ